MELANEYELEQMQDQRVYLETTLAAQHAGERPQCFLPHLEYPTTIRAVSIIGNGIVADKEDNSGSSLSLLLEAPRSEDVKGRIFIVQGGDDIRLQGGGQQFSAWIEADPEPRSRFIAAHLDNDRVARRELSSERDGVVFMNWTRLALQDKGCYEIEQRISAGRPYDIADTNGRDPARLHLDHKRYYRWPQRPSRSYGSVSFSEHDDCIYHAVEECMSLYSEEVGGVFTAVLLLDPVRYFRTVQVNYNFWKGQLSSTELPRTQCFLSPQKGTGPTVLSGNDKHPANGSDQQGCQQPMERLISLMKQHQPPAQAVATDKEPLHLIRLVFAQIVCEDLAPILDRINLALDEIELSLHDDRVLQRSMPVWRRQLGSWRNTLYHQGEVLRHLLSLDLAPSGTAVSGATVENNKLLTGLRSLAASVERTSRRVDADFQALMSSMSIVESERAIAEAESVSKLTQLAFFFIPLSLVAACFGMNINEFEGKLTWWDWLVYSVVGSVCTYTILYFTAIVSWAGTLPASARGLSIQGLSGLVVKWLSIVESIIEGLSIFVSLLVVVGFFAALSVATWKLSVSGLSTAAKAGIAVCVIWLPFFIASPAAAFVFIRRRRSGVVYEAARLERLQAHDVAPRI